MSHHASSPDTTGEGSVFRFSESDSPGGAPVWRLRLASHLAGSPASRGSRHASNRSYGPSTGDGSEGSGGGVEIDSRGSDRSGDDLSSPDDIQRGRHPRSRLADLAGIHAGESAANPGQRLSSEETSSSDDPDAAPEMPIYRMLRQQHTELTDQMIRCLIRFFFESCEDEEAEDIVRHWRGDQWDQGVNVFWRVILSEAYIDPDDTEHLYDRQFVGLQVVVHAILAKRKPEMDQGDRRPLEIAFFDDLTAEKAQHIIDAYEHCRWEEADIISGEKPFPSAKGGAKEGSEGEGQETTSKQQEGASTSGQT